MLRLRSRTFLLEIIIFYYLCNSNIHKILVHSYLLIFHALCSSWVVISIRCYSIHCLSRLITSAIINNLAWLPGHGIGKESTLSRFLKISAYHKLLRYERNKHLSLHIWNHVSGKCVKSMQTNLALKQLNPHKSTKKNECLNKHKTY